MASVTDRFPFLAGPLQRDSTVYAFPHDLEIVFYVISVSVDIFKETITLPGVARKMMYKSVDKGIHFSLFSKSNQDLFYTFKKNILVLNYLCYQNVSQNYADTL